MVLWSYYGRFCRGTPILVNLDNSPEVDKWLSKSGFRITNHIALFACDRQTDGRTDGQTTRIVTIVGRPS